MKTLLAIIGSLLVATFFYFFGVSKGWWRNIFTTTLPIIDDKPNACDPDRIGYRKDGVKDSYCGTVACNPNQPGYDMDGFPDPNCGFGRVQSRDISREIQIVQKTELQLSTSRITNAGKISYINQRLRDNGISDVMVIEKGTNPPPGFKLCDCKYGPQVISFGQWAFSGGCGGHSSGGQPCFGA